jgi:hypothetical protein
MLDRPHGVAPERVSRADATAGSVRDRQGLPVPAGGPFYCGITTVSSRARLWTSTRKTAGPLLPGAPNQQLRLESPVDWRADRESFKG